MERLLRGTGAPAGLLRNGTTLRPISAPRGESYGWLDFRVADMVQTAGRPTACTFPLNFEIDEAECGAKKKPYCWPNKVRDEVLARLLETNAQCTAQEEHVSHE